MNVQALRRTAENKGKTLFSPERHPYTAKTQLDKWGSHGTGANRR